MKKKILSERDIEKFFCAEAKRNGALTFKFTSPNCAGVPDRVLIAGGRVYFVEIKAPGKALRPVQVRRFAQLRTRGMLTTVVDSKIRARMLIGLVCSIIPRMRAFDKGRQT